MSVQYPETFQMIGEPYFELGTIVRLNRFDNEWEISLRFLEELHGLDSAELRAHPRIASARIYVERSVYVSFNAVGIKKVDSIHLD